MVLTHPYKYIQWNHRITKSIIKHKIYMINSINKFPQISLDLVKYLLKVPGFSTVTWVFLQIHLYFLS